MLTGLAAAWSDSGHEVHLLALHGGPDQAFHRVAQSIRLKFLALPTGQSAGVEKIVYNFRRIRILRAAIRDLAPDVVISFLDQCNVITLISTRGLGVPVIVSERTDPRHSASGRLWQTLCRLTYPLARSLVVQTEEVAALYASRRVRSVVAIPNAVYSPRPAETAALPSPYVISVGRLAHEKGPDLLVAAFAEVCRQYPDWVLVLVGEGPERQNLEAQCRRLGISERCIFLGLVTEITAALSGAELFILPSRCEGFPNALCEAMACGVASIATDCPSGPRNIIRDGVDGVLVPSEQPAALARAMGRLMSDPVERHRLGVGARDIVNRFALERILSLWNDVLREAMDGRQF